MKMKGFSGERGGKRVGGCADAFICERLENLPWFSFLVQTWGFILFKMQSKENSKLQVCFLSNFEIYFLNKI